MSARTATIKDLTASFYAAVENPENSPKGFVLWNRVDADVCLDAAEAGLTIPDEWYESHFDIMAEAVEYGLKAKLQAKLAAMAKEVS